MVNIPRFLIVSDGALLHLTWQCHNKDWFLKSDDYKQRYYDLLLKYKDRYEVLIHSYCFMSSHPHITCMGAKREKLSNFMKTVNSIFARWLNKKISRRGQVVMDRYKSLCMETSEDMLRVMHYIDLNPNRAGMITHPKDYKWSSFRYYAYGEEDPLITPAPAYLELGSTPEERQSAYLRQVEEILKDDWKQKKPYSSVPFLGSPDWVAQKMKDLKDEYQKRLNLWKARYKESFG
jgi:putative transposase